ncbi:MAG: hypothetical protein IPL40_11320 [Proteobacteria bacterium]|nr:hypothetical protein [Pseudomonadota bacterium]
MAEITGSRGWIRPLRCGLLGVGLALLAYPPAIAEARPDVDVVGSGAPAEGDAGEMEFAPETVEKSGPPSKALVRALELYRGGDYYGASIELYNVVEGRSGDSEVHRLRAEFTMGKTLHHLGFHSAALAYFDRVVQKGEAHPFFAETLKWLAALSQSLPEAVVVERLGKYKAKDLEQPVLARLRGELLYLLGRHHYGKQGVEQAAALFGAVPRGNRMYPRAKYMQGISFVRLGRGPAAAAAFKDVLRVAREAPATSEIQRFEQMALLALARVFYSTRQFELSIKYYERIDETSEDWPTALFESSWAHFLRNDFSKALGNIHTLNAPYFENLSFPESQVLRAVVYWKNCLYDQAEVAIEDFDQRYPKLQRQVTELLRRYADPAEMFQLLLKLRREAAGLGPELRRLLLATLADKQFQSALVYVDELARELKQIDAADAEWKASAIAGVILQDVALQKSFAENAAGELAQRRLKRYSAEINELQKQALKVQYEIINGRKNTLESGLRAEQVSRSPRQARPVVVDDEHHFWPFDGEYWRDELGYYRVKVASMCRQ